MHFNFLILFVAALIPLVIGFLWYNPKTFGRAWMTASGVTPENPKKTNMALVFGLTFLFSLFMAFILQMLVIHQIHTISILKTQPDYSNPNSEAALMLKKFIELFGTSYRTFKHGAFHGTIGGLALALPIITINALFERKSFKYIAINVGYWVVCMALMGGVICALV